VFTLTKTNTHYRTY